MLKKTQRRRSYLSRGYFKLLLFFLALFAAGAIVFWRPLPTGYEDKGITNTLISPFANITKQASDLLSNEAPDPAPTLQQKASHYLSKSNLEKAGIAVTICGVLFGTGYYVLHIASPWLSGQIQTLLNLTM